MLAAIFWFIGLIFWFIGYCVFVDSAIHLPDKFGRPDGHYGMSRYIQKYGQPGITSYFGRIYSLSGVCIFWFLGTLIHPAIFWFHVICIGICIFLFVFINGREHYKTTQIKKEQRREEERRQKLAAFTKGCTKKAIVWDLIGSVGGFSTAGLMTRTKESKKGWRLQHGATVVYRGPEGLIPTEKRFKIAEYNKKNRGKKIIWDFSLP